MHCLIVVPPVRRGLQRFHARVVVEVDDDHLAVVLAEFEAIEPELLVSGVGEPRAGLALAGADDDALDGGGERAGGGAGLAASRGRAGRACTWEAAWSSPQGDGEECRKAKGRRYRSAARARSGADDLGRLVQQHVCLARRRRLGDQSQDRLGVAGEDVQHAPGVDVNTPTPSWRSIRSLAKWPASLSSPGLAASLLARSTFRFTIA